MQVLTISRSHVTHVYARVEFCMAITGWHRTLYTIRYSAFKHDTIHRYYYYNHFNRQLIYPFVKITRRLFNNGYMTYFHVILIDRSFEDLQMTMIKTV